MELNNFDDFINITLGRKIDTDGFPKEQPYQCVDLAKYFNECYNPGFQVYCSKTGYAKDWATEKNSNGILEHFKETSFNNMIKGTLVVWGNSKVAPYSHIGFFVRDNGNGTFQCLQQNAPYPYVTLSNITYDGLIGAFIPNQLLNSSSSIEYINIPEWIPLRNVYNSIGVQIGALKPSKFGGLTYKVLGYEELKFGLKYAKISTRDFGECYVRITSSTPITTFPKYEHGNY